MEFLWRFGIAAEFFSVACSKRELPRDGDRISSDYGKNVSTSHSRDGRCALSPHHHGGNIRPRIR
jgi:hypothetical protein